MNGVENLPKASVQMVDESGRASQPWFRMFERFFAKPPRETALTVGASPFSYAATKDGFVVISGGTISQVTIARGVTSSPTVYNIGTQRQVVVRNGDVIAVTYSVAPAMAFYPD